NQSMRLDIKVLGAGRGKAIETKALLDSGAGGIFMSHEFTKSSGFELHPLERTIRVKNVDGTPNKKGEISHYTKGFLMINGRSFPTTFLIAGLGKESVILGLPWLRRINPMGEALWTKLGKNIVPTETRKATIEEVEDEEIAVTTLQDAEPIGPQDEEDTGKENPAQANHKQAMEQATELATEQLKETPKLKIEDDELLEYDKPRYGYSQMTKTISWIVKAKGSPRYAYRQNIWIREKTSVSQHLTHKKEGDAEQKTLNELLPKQYREYRRIFKKEASERFPESKPWDHAIELKTDFTAKDCRVYPLSPAEQKKLDEFLNESLQKGYIRPSKSPMASPFFFVAKKDLDVLRPCQDYRYLNNGTIKNTYLLPLVGDLLDNLRGAKWFMKLDI
ncbi:hypothetical protein L208DRAFT_1065089, partial [Tricholoma matsutake]